MIKLMVNLFVTLVTLCFVASSAITEEQAVVLDEKVRTIVENILQEKQTNSIGECSGGTLQRKVEYLENRLEQMDARLAEQDKTIAGLKNVIRQMERMNGNDNTLQRKDELRRNLTTTMRESREDVRRVPGRRIKRAVGNIAFSAYLTHTNSHTVIGQPIKFDQVLINDGQGYNKYTGAFTAPLSGVYLFTYEIDTRKLTFVRLVVNGKNQVDAVANVHTNAESRHSQSMGGNTAIIHVNHGESVLVETYEIPDAETASSNTFRLCTFSGVLLY